MVGESWRVRSLSLVALALAIALAACSSDRGTGSGGSGGTAGAGASGAGASGAAGSAGSDGSGGTAGRDASRAGGSAGSGGSGRTCGDNGDCDPTAEFCLKSHCDSATGVCAPRPGTRETVFCSPTGSLACGCDGQTYDYDCIAHAEGLNVASEGACPLPEGGAPCMTNADCNDDALYCNIEGCNGPGTCAPMPSFLSCFAGEDDAGASGPVCGCDHETYPDRCEAASDGTSIDHDGACVLPSGPCQSQGDCGGPSYAKVTHCLPDGCGSPAGHCAPIPGGCNTLFDPVCGCDAATYPNTCFSSVAGVAIAYLGGCRSGDIVDCDTDDTCPDGSGCVDDPRADCSKGACSGICITSDAPCGPYTSASGSGFLGCQEGTCVQSRVACGASGQVCGLCATGTLATCDADHPCSAPELCVQGFACQGDGPCPSACIRP